MQPRKTTVHSERVALHNFVQSLPEDTGVVQAATRAQLLLPEDRRQAVPNRSIAIRLLEAWKKAAAKEKPLAPVLQMPAQKPAAPNTDDEVLEAANFVKLHSMLKAGLYLVRVQ